MEGGVRHDGVADIASVVVADRGHAGGETAKPLTFATCEVLASRVAGRLGAVAA